MDFGLLNKFEKKRISLSAQEIPIDMLQVLSQGFYT